MVEASRIEELETALGIPLPDCYRQFLEEHRWVSHQPEWIVRTNPDRWGVQGLFELGNGPSYAQADETYRLTRDVLPTGLLPVGEDCGGNLYLIDCQTDAAPIFWWDHEKSAFNDGLEPVALSFHAFVADICPEE